MKVATVADMKADFPTYLKASAKGPVIVTRGGKPVAVLLAAGDDDVERLLMGHSPELQAILEAARRRFRSGAGIPHETFWKEVESEKASKRKKQNEVRKNGQSKR